MEYRKEIFIFFSKCIQVTATGPPNRLMETEKLGLACNAQFYSENGSPKNGDKENKWKTCIWKRNLDGAMCTIEYIDEYNFDKTQCDSSLGDVRIVGGKRSVCEIEIPEVTYNDLGNWTCTMEECKDQSMGGCKHKDSGSCKGESTVYVQVNQNLNETSSFYCDEYVNFSKYLRPYVYLYVLNRLLLK